MGRSFEHLIELPQQLESKGADLAVLDQDTDTSTAAQYFPVRAQTCV